MYIITKYFIELRHTGLNGGAGISSWDREQNLRFVDSDSSILKIIDLMSENGINLAKNKFSIFERLVIDSDFKNKIFTKDNDFIYNDIENITFFNRIYEDIANKKINTRTLGDKKDRKKYADENLKDIWPKTKRIENKKIEKEMTKEAFPSSLFPEEEFLQIEKQSEKKTKQATVNNNNITENDEIKKYIKELLLKLEKFNNTNSFLLLKEFQKLNYKECINITISSLRVIFEAIFRDIFSDLTNSKDSVLKNGLSKTDSFFNEQQRKEFNRIINSDLHDFIHARKVADKDYTTLLEYFNALKPLFEKLIEKFNK